MGRPPPAAMCTWIFLLLLLEACAGVAMQPLPPAAGHWRAQENKVLGGQPCKSNSQPWQTALFQGNQLLCGGVLIDDNWVLTAAHCKKPRYTVRLGEHSLQNKSGSGQERAVAQSIPHPCFSGDSEDHNHDLMLLRLREPASTGPSVKPINLTDHCPRDGQKCTVSGWGTITSPQENFPDALNCAEVKIVSQKRCEDAYPGKVTEAMICAGDSSGADSCQGDSGGPLVCGGVLQGITSWGSDPCGQPQRPGVYTNLCRYLDWIKKTMGSRSSA
ncbi:PREDICTED: kallikrein-8 isoform X1 [Myotis brandtii]|uniref:kallikrein-8 isoform X1 n=1 Tax=Myotis brandtii TaxID=109478 RepID=UPI0007040048|nr:PREDICTED: kallikrein-8 isoform X1 [Myotis brandtii]XP_014402932.1 PREDICTED: kallikrein-8 isoform X1 [Myotis brandtii]XP_014402934.1 PREDICTED: kallikrein-8 isoform X1 [Myotis brandtii]XP_014402935.1 PREDICTED: kallikrein-8 isoform X1 [Myotis brandtii]